MYRVSFRRCEVLGFHVVSETSVRRSLEKSWRDCSRREHGWLLSEPLHLPLALSLLLFCYSYFAWHYALIMNLLVFVPQGCSWSNFCSLYGWRPSSFWYLSCKPIHCCTSISESIKFCSTCQWEYTWILGGPRGMYHHWGKVRIVSVHKLRSSFQYLSLAKLHVCICNCIYTCSEVFRTKEKSDFLYCGSYLNYLLDNEHLLYHSQCWLSKIKIRKEWNKMNNRL